MSRNGHALVLFGAAAAALCAVLLTPFAGAEPISPAALWGGDGSLDRRILLEIRAPRVLLAFAAGAGLAVSGFVYQAVFRNYLACPFTLGVSSGAALGAALAMKLDLHLTAFGVPAVSLLALAGALGVIFTVVTLAGREASAIIVLLAGLVVSFICSSLIVLTQFLLDVGEVFSLTRWLMGGLAVVGFDVLGQVLPFVVLGIAYAFYARRELLLLSLGEELAWGRGLDVTRARNRHLVVSSAMVGAIVSLCGPIGFVGIMVPHACRLRLGVASVSLTLAVVALAGGIFLTLSDTVARTALAPYELPVGVITALLGGPYFLLLLLSKRREGTVR